MKDEEYDYMFRAFMILAIILTIAIFATGIWATVELVQWIKTK